MRRALLLLVLAACDRELAKLGIDPKNPPPPEPIVVKVPARVPELPAPAVCLLTTRDAVWLATSVGTTCRVPLAAGKVDDDALRAALDAIRPDYVGMKAIEVAGTDKADYQLLVDTMDVAIAAGFDDIGFMDPKDLSLKLPGPADAPLCPRR